MRSSDWSSDGCSSDLFAIGSKPVGNTLQQVGKGRHAVTRGLWEVGAGEERQQILRREEHGQRPATTTSGQRLMRELVDAIEIEIGRASCRARVCQSD